MAINIPLISSLDAKGFDKAARQFQALETTSAKAGFALKKAFLPAVAALAGLTAVATGAVKSASHLQEAQSKVGVIFGDSADSVNRFAKDAAEMYGLSKNQALDAAGTFGIFGKAAKLSGENLAKFSNKFTGLASDLASFNDSTPQEAINAIGSALRGESEPLRRFGVLLSDAKLKAEAMTKGLYKGSGVLSDQAKILAATSLIYKETTTAQGDFARTSESVANQQRKLTANVENLKTELGAKLLPVMQEILPLFIGLATWAGNSAPLLFTVGQSIAAIATAVVVATGAMKVWNAMAIITKAVNWALATSFTAVQVATVIGIGAAFAGAAAFVAISNKMNDARTAADNLAGGINGLTSATDNMITSQAELDAYIGPVASRNLGELRRFAYLAAEAAALLARDQEKAKIATDKANAANKLAAAAAKQLAGEIRTLKTAVGEDFADALGRANTVLITAKDAFKDYAASVSAAVKEVFNFGNAQKSAVDNQKDLADALADQSKAQKAVDLAKLSDDTDDLAAAQAALAIATKVVIAAQNRPMTFADELKLQADKVKDFGVLVNRLIAGGLSQDSLQQVLAAGTDAGSAIATELLSSAGGILNANALTAQTQAIADAAGLNSASKFMSAGVTMGQNLVNGISSIVDKYKMKLSSKGLTTKQIKALQKNFGISVEFGFAGTAATSVADAPAAAEAPSGFTLPEGFTLPPGFVMPALAAGGLVTGPTVAMVGEAGPELVIPLDRLGSMGGGSGDIYITVQGGLISTPDQIGRDIIDAIQRTQRRNGAVFVSAV